MQRCLHLRDARIWTGDADRPRAGSVTIVDGRISDLDGPDPSDGVVIDGRGRFVVPGLIDAHVHLLMGGLALEHVDLSGVRDRGEFERTIAEAHAHLPEGRWLVAQGWSNERWRDSAMPDKSWLESAGRRPVVCNRMDLHAMLVNDAVLERIATDDDPPGGRIVRDATGAPTGLLVEAAAWQLVNPLIPQPDRRQKRRALCAAQAHAHRCGLTTVGSMEYQSDVESIFVPERHELTLRCRITLLDREWPIDTSFGRSFDDDEMLAVIGYKAFTDGTLGSRTARMLEPYDDDPGNRGLLVELAADGHLDDWARRVAAAGLSPSVHAIGDEAARLALDALEGIAPARRPRIEHAQQIDPGDISRFAGIIASMQPLHKADDGRFVRARVGDRRLGGTFAFRTLLDAGARLAFGSDWPVVSCDPLAGMATAVTGRTLDGKACLTEQNLESEEALRAYTSGSAYALGLDDAGVLRRGALGDLVVLEGDPLAGGSPRVLVTVVGGNVVYDAERACPTD
ncbi:MAG: amidohydrolase [Planctomycetota bacterium]|jgi:predicted amidohydrolase YtcJ